VGTDKTITVCHLVSGDLWAGAEVQAFNIISSLALLPQFDVAAVILNEGKLAEKLRRVGVTVIVVDESAVGFLSLQRQVKKRLEGKQFDIVHSHRYKENLLAVLLKRGGYAQHLIQTVHGLGEPFRGLKRLKVGLYGILGSYLSNKIFDKIHTVSHDIATILSKNINSEKLVTIHNSINTAALKINRSRAEIRAELGIGENVPVVGTVGRMVAVKGIEMLLNSAKEILDQKPETLLLLVGDGPLIPALKETARRLGILDSTRFLGFRSDAIDIINALDIFAITSLHEGIPTVVLEAMKLKSVVVATAVGGIPEIIEDDLSGVLVKSRKSHDFAQACLKLLSSPETRARLGTEAERIIDERFTIEYQRDQMVRTYLDLVDVKN